MTRIALGTVQFGLSYGIANRSGKVPVAEVARLLSCAREAGIDLIDTASSYGDSEAVLGACGIEGWNVVTKLGEVPDACSDLHGWVDDQVANSLARLGKHQLEGLMLHRPQQLVSAWGGELWRALERQKALGRVLRVGYSIYEPAELDVLYERFPADIVQSPFNPLDRRLLRSGWLDRLSTDGVSVHTRSAFLQGLLLMNPRARPRWTQAHASVLAAFDEWAMSVAGGPQSACLAYCLSQPQIEHVVIGVQSVAQLEQALLATAIMTDAPPDWLGRDIVELVDPRCWPKE